MLVALKPVLKWILLPVGSKILEYEEIKLLLRYKLVKMVYKTLRNYVCNVCSNATSITKKGSETLPSNYRPISLLPVILLLLLMFLKPSKECAMQDFITNFPVTVSLQNYVTRCPTIYLTG